MTDWTKIVRAVADPRGKKPAPAIVAMIADHADEQFPKWGFTTLRRQAALLTHICVETANFTTLEENLDYRAERLTQVWPKRFPTIASATPYAHKPQALAIKVYGGRLGNRPGTDDGWTFRGHGLLQATGRDKGLQLGKLLGVSPEVASSWLMHPDHALEAACALFVMLGAMRYADAGDVDGQTLRINGGKNGLAERKAAWSRAIKALSAEAAKARVAVIETQPEAIANVEDDPPPDLQDTLAELRAAGSRTIAGADLVKSVATKALGGDAVASIVQSPDAIGKLQDAYAGFQHGADVMELIKSYWPIPVGLLLALLIAWLAWRAIKAADKIAMARVDDAVSGLNIGR
jgi:predicted chitinase